MNINLDENSVVAKVAFLLLLLIIFVLLLKFGIYIMGWIFSFSQDPYLIKGTASGNKMKVFPQDPNKKMPFPYYVPEIKMKVLNSLGQPGCTSKT